VVYHGASYPKVSYWATFFRGKKELKEKWNLSLEDILLSISLPRGKVGKPDVMEVERLIHQEKITLIHSLMLYEGKKTRDVLDAYLMRYEIHNIVEVVLSLLYHRPVTMLYDLGRGHRIQKPYTDEVKNLKDVQSLLFHTPYYRLAQDAFAEMERTGDTFSFEVQLSNLFLKKLFKAIKQSGELQAWKDTLLFALSMERVLFVARMKFNYHSSVEEVLAYFPVVLENRDWWRRLLMAKDFEEFVALLSFVLKGESVQDLQQLSQVLSQKVVKRLWRFLHVPTSAHFIGAFIALQEFMVENLQVIIEGKRYNFSWNQIASFVVEGGSHAVF